MPIFTAIIDQRAVAAEADMFQIKAPITDTGQTTVGGVRTNFPETASDIRVREIRLGQFTEFADAAAELLSVRIIKFGGDTGLIDTGNAAGGTNLRVVPSPIDSHNHSDTGTWSGARVVVTNPLLAKDTGFALAANETKVIVADTVNVAAGWWWYPPEEEMIIIKPGEALVVRLSSPADSITWNGTLVFENIGRASP